MEKGVKTLETAAKVASRRRRLAGDDSNERSIDLLAPWDERPWGDFDLQKDRGDGFHDSAYGSSYSASIAPSSHSSYRPSDYLPVQNASPSQRLQTLPSFNSTFGPSPAATLPASVAPVREDQSEAG